MHGNLALELVRVTEAAALAAARTMGVGKIPETHRAAVKAMHLTLNQVAMDGHVVLGEGVEGEAESLFHRCTLGAGGRKVDLLVLPIDGPTSCAQGLGNATSAVAASEKGTFLQTPDIYYEKLAVGPLGKDVIDLKKSATENLENLARVKNVYVQDLTVAVLDRPRHTELIREIREAGARIRLLPDGDVGGALATGIADIGIDLLMGTGRAREGLLAAAALYAMGGDMQMRPKCMDRAQNDALRKANIHDGQKIFTLDQLVSGEIFFAATGITHSDVLKGIHFVGGGAVSHSLVVRSGSGTLRQITSRHHFDRNPQY
jgi:fructose-1,6-bisphosphatase II